MNMKMNWKAYLFGIALGIIIAIGLINLSDYIADWSYHHIIYWQNGIPGVVTIEYTPMFIVIPSSDNQSYTIDAGAMR